jgi:integrase
MAARRRFGRVRKLPSGRWQARYLGPDGRDHPAPVTFASKTDAAQWLAHAESDIRRDRWRDPSVGRELLTAYAEAWLDQRTVKGRPLAPRTVDGYRHSLKAWILPNLGSLPVTKISAATVRSWHAETLRSTGPTATRQAYSLLRAILATAVEDELLDRNPCTIKGAGQSTSPERPLLSPDDVTVLAGQMPSHLSALVLLGCWGALRLGELLGLRVGDVDLQSGILHVERQVVEIDGHGPVECQPKVGSMRPVHLPTQMIDAMRSHLDWRGPALPSARVFVRPDGTELRAHHVHCAWQSARRRAGYPGAHIHDLRHAGLTLAAQRGATLAEVMRRAGHVSARAAMVYQHAASERDAEIARRLSDLG